VLLETISEEEIGVFVTRLKEKPAPKYMQFLCILCTCEGLPLPSNQEYICRTVLEEGGDSILPLQVANSDEISIRGRHDEWVPLEQFVLTANKKAIRYVILCIELLANLCLVRQSESRKERQLILTIDLQGGNTYTSTVIFARFPVKAIIKVCQYLKALKA